MAEAIQSIPTSTATEYRTNQHTHTQGSGVRGKKLRRGAPLLHWLCCTPSKFGTVTALLSLLSPLDFRYLLRRSSSAGGRVVQHNKQAGARAHFNGTTTRSTRQWVVACAALVSLCHFSRIGGGRRGRRGEREAPDRWSKVNRAASCSGAPRLLGRAAAPTDSWQRRQGGRRWWRQRSG